jgi:hypothetical protein
MRVMHTWKRLATTLWTQRDESDSTLLLPVALQPDGAIGISDPWWSLSLTGETVVLLMAALL